MSFIKLDQILSFKWVLSLYIIFALAASIQSLYSPVMISPETQKEYTAYNNYIIFKNSYVHFKNNQDLYKAYPEEQNDLYKYSPTFALFFAVFEFFPDYIGLNLWNLLNALVLLFSVYLLPGLNDSKKGAILLVSMLELITSMQNEQSNSLIAGLLIFSFVLLEKKNSFLAIFCLTFTVFIKLFGLVGFALLIFYPQKLKSILYSLFWFSIFLGIPLFFKNIQQYHLILESWGKLLSEDHESSSGISVMGFLQSTFNIYIDKSKVVLFGILFFLLPLVNFKAYKTLHFRFLALCSMLIWVVIFNHKAESPTYIIAMSGVAIWFFIGPITLTNKILLFLAILLTSLSPTDIIPRWIRNEWIIAYSLKALPCFLIWLKIIFEMMTFKAQAPEIIENQLIV